MNGWLLDTNVIAELTRPHGTVRVQLWAAAQEEDRLFLSVLSVGEYDKGLHHLPQDNPLRARIAAGIAALEVRFAGRILTLSPIRSSAAGVLSAAKRSA